MESESIFQRWQHPKQQMGKFLSPQGRLVWSAQRVQFTNIPFFRFLRFYFELHEKKAQKNYL